VLTTAFIQQAIAHHKQALQNIPESADVPERWKHLGAIAALEAQLDEYIAAAVEGNIDLSQISIAPQLLSPEKKGY
jgi:hypothetical protein